MNYFNRGVGSIFRLRGCKIKFWPPIEYRPGVTIQWIFRWIKTLPSCWILIAPLNFDTLLSRNSTGRRYVDGSEFHVELWPRVNIPRWIVTLDQNFTLKCDPDLGAQFNVKLGPRVIIQRGIMTRGQYSKWNHDPGSQFNVESWPGVSIQHGIIAVYLETFQAPSLCTDISGMWGSTTSEASLFCLALFLYSFKIVQRGSGYSLLKYPLISTSTVAIRILKFSC